MWSSNVIGALLLALIALLHGCEQGGSYHECKLRQALFEDPTPCLKDCLPKVEPGQNVTVDTSIWMEQIVHVDEGSQVTTLHILLTMTWNSTLTWNKDDYGGLESLGVTSDTLWVPDIMLFTAVKVERVFSDVLLLLHASGMAMYAPQLIVTIPCVFDTYTFPFDAHRCTMNVGSWVYSIDDLYVNVPATEQRKEVRQGNSVWNVNVLRHESGSIPAPNTSYSILVCEIELVRFVEVYCVVLIVPGILLNILSLAVFYVPPALSDKLAISLSICLSYFVLLTILMDAVPSAGSRIPLLGQYYMVSLILNCLIICCSILVLNVHQRHPRPFPKRYLGILKSYSALLCTTDKASSFDRNQVVDLTDKDRSESLWPTLATLMDRVFFLIFVLVTVLSTAIFAARIML